METPVSTSVLTYADHLEEAARKPGHALVYYFRDHYMQFFHPEGRILDLGSFVGATVLHYAELGHEAVGVEAAPTYIRASRGRAKALGLEDRATFVHSMVEDYQPDAPFDACCCTEMLEHTPDPQAIVNKAFECLRPGGIFFVTSPALKTPSSLRLLTLDDLKLLLLGAGFQVTQAFTAVFTARWPQNIAEGTKP
uniref:Putative methyltransferase n=1 Tax=viral metagenome TaxID=1070528 RepID=A0A6H1ZXB9_9ZZZZ